MRATLFRYLLPVIGFIVLVGALIVALIHFEQDSSQSSIVDLSNALWYVVVTLASVGYGDLYPVTIYGRIIGYILVIGSLGVYGLFIGRVASFMQSIQTHKKMGHNGTSFKQHIVIIGWNDVSKLVADQLIHVHKEVAIITDRNEDIDTIYEYYKKQRAQVFVLCTDLSNYEYLRKAGIEQANVVFLNLEKDVNKLVYLLNVKKIYPQPRYAVVLEETELKTTFLNAGVQYVVAKNDIASSFIASYIFEPDVAQFSEDMIAYAKKEQDYDIKQYIVARDNPYCDKSYEEAFFLLKKTYNVVLIGLSQLQKDGQYSLRKNPREDVQIQAGDYLIVIVNHATAQQLEGALKLREGI